MSERRGRSGGRAARQAARAERAIEEVPFLTRRLAPFEVLSEEGLALIEHNADTLLEEVGVEVTDYPSALRLFADAGARVEETRVRFPRGLVRSLIPATTPSSFVQHARNPARSVQLGADSTVFAPAYGSPFVRDLDNGRRYATIEDFRNFVRLAYLSPDLHHSGGTVCEPVDEPVPTRHLDMVEAHIRFTDKPFMGSVTAATRAEDSVELARIAFGGDLAGRTVLTSLINAASPLTWDGTMLGAAEVYARHNQASIFTPFILAGAMAPVTPAAVCTQILAESMVGIAFSQLVNPGAPAVLGAFVSTIDMQSGAPTFGTPETALIMYAVAALARRLDVPFRTGGHLCASKIADAQAAYESSAVMQPTMLAGTNFVLHAAGWLEGGLSMGYEKFVLDADQLGAYRKIADGMDLSENGQGMSAFRENQPGVHYLGTQHTLDNFETAFWKSSIADANSYEQWLEEGSKDANTRANARWKEMLASYEPPPLDDAISEELSEFIARRKNELPKSEY
ncbi:MAG: trimethylamine methyltransferase family protein [Acidimicrobiia bacterium]|nr:trimethylamine methyltransferase family protein [Acidimicrobiia bacterium]